MRRAKSAEEYLKFHIKIDKITECHLMDKVPMNSGYVLVNTSRWGKIYNVSTAHQLSYIINFGDYDRDLNVNHKCNVRSCVNPNHLYVGTQKENMKDKCNINNQHRPRGEINGMAKLLPYDIKKIKELGKYYSNVYIAKMFGVCRQHIGDILKGKRWGHIN